MVLHHSFFLPSLNDMDGGKPSLAKPNGLLEPLPTFNLIPSVDKLDAGLRSLDHCKRVPMMLGTIPYLTYYQDRTKLPLWRYTPRQRLIPLVRWETPHLAAIQKAVRTPALDTYFSITANLGTHTFFMVFLPILFWCGYTDLGRGYGGVICYRKRPVC